jgi:hypothetical protein
LEGNFTPAEAEVVFLTISAENNYHYCMGAHSLFANTVSKVPVEVRLLFSDNLNYILVQLQLTLFMHNE